MGLAWAFRRRLLVRGMLPPGRACIRKATRYETRLKYLIMGQVRLVQAPHCIWVGQGKAAVLQLQGSNSLACTEPSEAEMKRHFSKESNPRVQVHTGSVPFPGGTPTEMRLRAGVRETEEEGSCKKPGDRQTQKYVIEGYQRW